MNPNSLSSSLDEAVLVRPADALLLLGDWTPVTTDDFSWSARPPGARLFPEAHPVLLLDGFPVPHAPFEAPNPNLMPFLPVQIDSVDASGDPDPESGATGLLQVHTRAPSPGWSLTAHTALGNPTGDPGPFRYTDPSLPNVDKIGPDYALGASWAGEEAAVRVQVPVREHFATAPALFDRVSAGRFDYPKLTFAAPVAQARWRGAGGLHTFLATRSVLHDSFFFRPIGRELPTRRTQTLIGARSRFDPTSRLHLDVRGLLGALDIRERANPLPTGFAWESRTADLTVRAGYRVWSGRVHGGLRVEHTVERTDESDPLSAATVFGGFEGIRIRGIRLGGGARVRSNAEQRTAQGGMRVLVPAAPGQSLTLSLHAARLPFEATHPVLFWTARAWPGLARTGIGLVASDGSELSLASLSPPAARLLSASAGWTRQGPAWRIDVIGSWRHASRLAATDQAIFLVEDALPSPGPIVWQEGRDGRAVDGVVHARFTPPIRLRAEAFYAAGAVAGGDAGVRARAGSVPRHRARLAVTVLPGERLSFHAAARGRTSTTWSTYRSIDPETGRAVPARLAGFVTVDVGARKRFWGARGRAGLAVRDVFDRRPRYHPLGASLGLRFHAVVTLEL